MLNEQVRLSAYEKMQEPSIIPTMRAIKKIFIEYGFDIHDITLRDSECILVDFQGIEDSWGSFYGKINKLGWHIEAYNRSVCVDGDDRSRLWLFKSQ